MADIAMSCRYNDLKKTRAPEWARVFRYDTRENRVGVSDCYELYATPLRAMKVFGAPSSTVTSHPR
jgi:hypothetical protein